MTRQAHVESATKVLTLRPPGPTLHKAIAGLDEHTPLCADCLAMVADLLDGYRDDREGAIERARSLVRFLSNDDVHAGH